MSCGLLNLESFRLVRRLFRRAGKPGYTAAKDGRRYNGRAARLWRQASVPDVEGGIPAARKNRGMSCGLLNLDSFRFVRRPFRRAGKPGVYGSQGWLPLQWPGGSIVASGIPA